MELKFFKLPTSVGDLSLQVARGHFATRNSHTNYFIDLTSKRCSLKEAGSVARQLADRLRLTMVDTIVCMDNTRTIGTCLAQQLTEGGYRSMNAGEDIYLLRDNVYIGGKLIFRDNVLPMLKGKNVLILLSAVTTGSTAQQGVRCARYYGGNVVGVASVYSFIDEVDGIPVTSLFNAANLSDYASYPPESCPLCAKGIEVDALVDRYGYSSL